MERYQKYKVASVVFESPETYCKLSIKKKSNKPRHFNSFN